MVHGSRDKSSPTGKLYVKLSLALGNRFNLYIFRAADTSPDYCSAHCLICVCYSVSQFETGTCNFYMSLQNGLLKLSGYLTLIKILPGLYIKSYITRLKGAIKFNSQRIDM